MLSASFAIATAPAHSRSALAAWLALALAAALPVLAALLSDLARRKSQR